MPGDKSLHRIYVSSSQLHRCHLFDTQSTQSQAESASNPAVYVSSVFLTVDASASVHGQSLMPATSHSSPAVKQHWTLHCSTQFSINNMQSVTTDDS